MPAVGRLVDEHHGEAQVFEVARRAAAAAHVLGDAVANVGTVGGVAPLVVGQAASLRIAVACSTELAAGAREVQCADGHGNVVVRYARHDAQQCGREKRHEQSKPTLQPVMQKVSMYRP